MPGLNKHKIQSGYGSLAPIYRSHKMKARCACLRLCLRTLIVVAAGMTIRAKDASGQAVETMASPSALKKMSVEELMNVEVTSVSRQAEPWFTSPSAIQVITQED